MYHLRLHNRKISKCIFANNIYVPRSQDLDAITSLGEQNKRLVVELLHADVSRITIIPQTLDMYPAIPDKAMR